MDLVDDVDFVAALRGGVADVVAQVAHLLDAVVRGAVDLEHVEAAALGDFDADVLLRIELGGRPVLGLERLGQDARGGGLAVPRGPTKR